MAFHRRLIFGAINPRGAGLAYYSTPRSIPWPPLIGATINFTVATMDAATEKVAMIGRLFMKDRTTSTKTLDTSGSSSIGWRAGTITFADAATSMDVGIQGVAAGAGPIAQPDGSFSVKAVCTTGGGNAPTTAAWNTTVPTTGTVSLTHGDMVAVVWDMTARGGVDSVIVDMINSSTFSSSGRGQLPTTNAFISSAWQTTAIVGAGLAPNVVLTFSDGTIGTINLSPPISVFSTESFADATNPDERGMLFQVPWSCMVDGFWANLSPASAAGDFDICLYSDPTGTPTPLATASSILAEQLGQTGPGSVSTFYLPLATEVSLTRATDYVLAIKATGAANVNLTAITVGNAGHKTFYGDVNYNKVTRNGGSGAFTAESDPKVTIYPMGVMMSQLQS